MLDGADEAILGVAFVQRRGVSLVERQLQTVGAGRLVATTVFGSTTSEGLEATPSAGFGVRVLNLSGGTFHPKLYLARHGERDRGRGRLGEPHQRTGRQRGARHRPARHADAPSCGLVELDRVLVAHRETRSTGPRIACRERARCSSRAAPGESRPPWQSPRGARRSATDPSRTGSAKSRQTACGSRRERSRARGDRPSSSRRG